MKVWVTGAYSLTGTVYLFLILWLVLQGKARELSQRIFVSWLFLLAVLGVNGTFISSLSGDPGLAFLLYRVQLSTLIASGVALWFFATDLRREVGELDVLYTIPALLIISILWTILAKGVKATPYGWDIIFGKYQILLFGVVLYGYYAGAVVQLAQVISVLKRGGSRLAIRRVRFLFYPVVIITLSGLLIPIGRALDMPFTEVIVSVLYTIPAGFMAYSFRLTE